MCFFSSRGETVESDVRPKPTVIFRYQVGLFVTARVGTGLVVARRRDGGWSAPSALGSVGLGWGFQIGGEVRRFVVVVLVLVVVLALVSQLSALVVVVVAWCCYCCCCCCCRCRWWWW